MKASAKSIRPEVLYMKDQDNLGTKSQAWNPSAAKMNGFTDKTGIS